MKKKAYEHPSMHVIEMKKHAPMLLTSGNARMQDYNVNTSTLTW